MNQRYIFFWLGKDLGGWHMQLKAQGRHKESPNFMLRGSDQFLTEPYVLTFAGYHLQIHGLHNSPILTVELQGDNSTELRVESHCEEINERRGCDCCMSFTCWPLMGVFIVNRVQTPFRAQTLTRDAPTTANRVLHMPTIQVSTEKRHSSQG